MWPLFRFQSTFGVSWISKCNSQLISNTNIILESRKKTRIKYLCWFKGHLSAFISLLLWATGHISISIYYDIAFPENQEKKNLITLIAPLYLITLPFFTYGDQILSNSRNGYQIYMFRVMSKLGMWTSKCKATVGRLISRNLVIKFINDTFCS